MPRERLLLIDDASGLEFHFFFEPGTRELHITYRWGVTPDTAIATFFDPTAQRNWIAAKRCWETSNQRYTLAWLWADATERVVIVITCVDRERTTP